MRDGWLQSHSRCGIRWRWQIVKNFHMMLTFHPVTEYGNCCNFCHNYLKASNRVAEETERVEVEKR